RKKIADITDVLAREEADTAEFLAGRGGDRRRAPTPALGAEGRRFEGLAASGASDLDALIRDLNDQMLQAAAELKFELAGRLRDEVADLKKELRRMEAAGHI